MPRPIPALLRTLCALCLLSSSFLARGQSVKGEQPAVLSGHVTDASNALVPGAQLALECAGSPAATTTADSGGRYSFSVERTGTCTLAVTAEGFAPYRSAPFTLSAGRARALEVKLAVSDVQRIEVAPETGDPTDPAANGDSTTLRGKAIDDLPMDTNELQQQLNALAGGDTPEMRIDGFPGGRLPPKSSIREIRINQNPYSAQNDVNPNSGYFEIFTKPGGNQFHGENYSYGNSSALNSISPLLTQAPPPYYSFGLYTNLSGPLSKHASFFVADSEHRSTSNSIIKAQVLDASNNQVVFTQAVAGSETDHGGSVRIDASIGTKSTFLGRYDVNVSSSDNAGIGNLSLPTQGYGSGEIQQTLQLSNSQVLSKNVVNDTRFQYIRTRNHQTPVSSSPAIVVQGAFNGGGNNTGNFRDNTDRYELQSYTSAALGKHFLNFGMRFRDTRDANSSSANYNGQFIFTSLDSYQATVQGVAGAGPSQYSITTGTPSVVVNVADIGFYLQDDWKPRANLTISPGLRYEWQNHISDKADWAPRLGLAYSFGSAKGKPAKWVARGGAGIFYTRFASGNVLQAARQNGISQKQYVISTPTFYAPNFHPADPSQLGGAVSSSTTFQINPSYRAPRLLAASVSLQRMFGQIGSLTLAYSLNSARHTQVTRNINAPLPGTYDPTNPSSGVRPLGSTAIIYQYDSPGVYNSQRLALNWFMNLRQKFFLYGNVQGNWQNSDTWGGFPSNQYNVGADYGRAPTPVYSLNLGGGVPLPWGFRFSPYLVARTGRPFNITTGTDLNGDSQYNDRPAFATDLSRASVVHTAYGVFDTQPIAGQTIIPIDYGMGPATFLLNATLNKTFKIGPREKAPATPPAAAGAAGKTPSAKPGKPDRKYELAFYISAQNALNHVNYAPPVGTLSSPLFGKFVTMSGGFGPAAGSANRFVLMQSSFRF